eukprot:TRINITY_DN3801_c0_g3_i2.p1 TRINITY_DN3801_c0_g3~~TRINITY_DN3801_c0_g3_i2.p1  ORF type:complete len:329 (-),score=57.58 TRINITY_DN3801_c0_g3_i2:48-1034(-)
MCIRDRYQRRVHGMSYSASPLLAQDTNKDTAEKRQSYLLKIIDTTYNLYKGERELPNKLIMTAREECSDNDRNTYPTQVEFLVAEDNVGTLQYKSSSLSVGNCSHKLTLYNQETYEMKSTYFVNNPFKVAVRPYFKSKSIGASEIREVSCLTCLCSLFPSFLILALAAAAIFAIGKIVSNSILFGVISLGWFGVLLFFGIFYMCRATHRVMDIKVMHLLRASNELSFAEVYTKLRYSDIPPDTFTIVAYKTLSQGQLMALMSAIIRSIHFDLGEEDDQKQEGDERSGSIYEEQKSIADCKTQCCIFLSISHFILHLSLIHISEPTRPY